MKDIKVLMTGAGAPGAPGIISCYRNNGERTIKVVGVDIKNRVPTIKHLGAFHTIPPASSPDFIKSILTIAKTHDIDVIQPLVTKELEVFSEHKKIFMDEDIKVCVSPIENLRIANDKGLLLSNLKEEGIEVPEHTITTKSTEFHEACVKMGYPEKVICFKPTKSNGSRGFRIIDNTKDRGKLLFGEKPNSTYIKFEEANEILKSMIEIPELLVMEYLPGDEYSVDMLVDNGTVYYCIPRLRKAMNGGISTSCVIENNQNVIEYCFEVAKHLKLHGNIGIQVRFSRDGKVKILEINPRVQGSIVACAAAGVNLPYLGIKQVLRERIPKVNIKWDVEMVRYWNEVYFDNEGHAFTL